MVTDNEHVRIRLLLVEDSDHDWLAFQRVCRASAFACSVTRYVRAEEALARLAEDFREQRSEFNLLVTDHKLPGMSGLDLCLELLDQQVHLPMVLLTGAGSEHLAVEALKAGVSDYLIKDVDQGYLALLPVVLPEVVRQYEDRMARQRAEAAVKRHNQELTLLNRMGQELAMMLDQRQVIEHLLQGITELLNAEGASLWLGQGEYAESEPCLTCCGFYNVAQQDFIALEGLVLQPKLGIVGWVVQHGQSIALEDAQADPRFYAGVDQRTGLHTHALMAVPLRVRDAITGVLEVVNQSMESDDAAHHLQMLETVAISAAIALDNAALVEALRQRTGQLQLRNQELETALDAIKTLSGLVPICAWCGRKIEDEAGNWVPVEAYIKSHTGAEFTHGICPDCLKKWNPSEGE